MNSLIGIYSRSRSWLADESRGTFRYFPDHCENLRVFVREQEYESYRSSQGDRVVVVPFDNVPQTIDFMAEYARERGIDTLIAMDDDLTLSRRDESVASKYRTGTPADMQEFLRDSLAICGREYPICGAPTKQGSQARKYLIEKNSRIIHATAYFLPVLKEEGISAFGLREVNFFMWDMFVHISLLSRGYRSIVNCKYALDDPGMGYRGGANDVRTAEHQNKASTRLSELFPGYVTLREKQNFGAHWKERRKDITVHWKRFLDPGELPYIPFEEAGRRFGIVP